MSANNKRLDRDALHKFLWDRCDRFGRVRIHQVNLAEALDVTKHTISRIFSEFIDEGRMKRINRGRHGVGTYTIADPATWKTGAADPKEPRRVQWG